MDSITKMRTFGQEPEWMAEQKTSGGVTGGRPLATVTFRNVIRVVEEAEANLKKIDVDSDLSFTGAQKAKSRAATGEPAPRKLRVADGGAIAAAAPAGQAPGAEAPEGDGSEASVPENGKPGNGETGNGGVTTKGLPPAEKDDSGGRLCQLRSLREFVDPLFEVY